MIYWFRVSAVTWLDSYSRWLWWMRKKERSEVVLVTVFPRILLHRSVASISAASNDASNLDWQLTIIVLMQLSPQILRHAFFQQFIVTAQAGQARAKDDKIIITTESPINLSRAGMKGRAVKRRKADSLGKNFTKVSVELIPIWEGEREKIKNALFVRLNMNSTMTNELPRESRWFELKSR